MYPATSIGSRKPEPWGLRSVYIIQLRLEFGLGSSLVLSGYPLFSDEYLFISLLFNSTVLMNFSLMQWLSVLWVDQIFLVPEPDEKLKQGNLKNHLRTEFNPQLSVLNSLTLNYLTTKPCHTFLL